VTESRAREVANGAAGAVGAGGDRVFFENDVQVDNSYTITTDKNSVSAGPISIASGAVVTIPANSVWSVV
jgi:hypothetical protein